MLDLSLDRVIVCNHTKTENDSADSVDFWWILDASS